MRDALQWSLFAVVVVMSIAVHANAQVPLAGEAILVIDRVRNPGPTQDSVQERHVVPLSSLRAHDLPKLTIAVGIALPSPIVFQPEISADVLCADTRPYGRTVSAGGTESFVSGIGDAPATEQVMRGTNGRLGTITTQWRRARDGWYAERTVISTETPARVRLRYTLTLPDEPALKPVRRVRCPAPEPDGAEAPNGGRTHPAAARVPRSGG
jgi:hypothetical protein